VLKLILILFVHITDRQTAGCHTHTQKIV